MAGSVSSSSLPQVFALVLVLVLAVTCTVHALDARTTDEENGPDVTRLQLGNDDIDPLRSYMLSRIVDDLQMVSSPQYQQRQQRRAQEMTKRQIRFHQCYFNPVSCFRRRK